MLQRGGKKGGECNGIAEGEKVEKKKWAWE